MKNLIITIIIMFCIVIVLSFYMGMQAGHERCLTETIRADKEMVDILKTLRTSQEYYIADEKRKNAAFQEVVEIYMGEK